MPNIKTETFPRLGLKIRDFFEKCRHELELQSRERLHETRSDRPLGDAIALCIVVATMMIGILAVMST